MNIKKTKTKLQNWKNRKHNKWETNRNSKRKKHKWKKQKQTKGNKRKDNVKALETQPLYEFFRFKIRLNKKFRA